MSIYPGAAVVRVLGSQYAVQVRIVRAKAIYARAGIQAIALNDEDVAVTFTTPLPSTDYVLGGLTLVNLAAPDPFLQIKGVSILSQTGFTVRLSAPAPTANFVLHWSIAEEYNP